MKETTMKETTQTGRYNNYDLLRILATIAVILIHVNYQYFAYRAYTPSMDKYYIIESVFNMVSRFAVPIFVMLSGAFLLHKESNGDAKTFYKKSSRKLLLPTLVAMAVFLLIDEISAVRAGQGYMTPIKSVLEGSFYNLWFMYMLLGLYLLTPFIVKLKNAISARTFERMTYVLLVWAVISQATTTYQTPYSLGVIGAYLSYFLMGNVIFEKTKDGCKRPAWLYFLGAAVVFAVTFVIRYEGYTRYLFDAYTNFFSPMIMLASILIFYGFSGIHIKRDFSKLASLMFYVYLFHTIIYRHVFAVTNVLFINEIFAIGEVTVLTFIIGGVFGYVYDRLWKLVWKNCND